MRRAYFFYNMFLNSDVSNALAEPGYNGDPR